MCTLRKQRKRKEVGRITKGRKKERERIKDVRFNEILGG